MLELNPVDRITAGAVGDPGKRVFYLQGRKDQTLVTLVVEKYHVQMLALSVLEMLSGLEKQTAPATAPDDMDLEEPIAPEWRVGKLGLGYDEGRDLVVLEAEEQVAEDDQQEREPEEPARVRFWATREQMLALARQGAEVVARGRPLCDLCGFPVDPEGHLCPALNGHGEVGRA